MIFDASNSHIQSDFSHISVYKKYTANKPSKLGFVHLKTRALRLKIIYEPSKLFTLPINAITALLGIPIVVWVVLRNKSVTA